MKKYSTFMGESRHYAGIAASHIRKLQDIRDIVLGTDGPEWQVGKIEQLEKWKAIMLPCFVGLLCICNVLTALLEFYIQQPIWAYLSPDPESSYVGWAGAMAMILIGAYASHCFAKFFVGELQEWWIYMRMTRTDKPDLDDVRKGCSRDTQRDAIKGSAILIPTALWVYFLSKLRVEQEALALGVEPVFSVLDWLPTVIYMLNATVMGVFWEYVFKKRALESQINQLEANRKAEYEAAHYAGEKVIQAVHRATEEKEPGSANLPREVRFVIAWMNEAIGLNYDTDLIQSFDNETVFVFCVGNQPLKGEPVLVTLDDDSSLPLLFTDKGGIIIVRWFGPQKSIIRVRLLHKDILLAEGPWLSGTYYQIDVSGQLPERPALSLN